MKSLAILNNLVIWIEEERLEIINHNTFFRVVSDAVGCRSQEKNQKLFEVQEHAHKLEYGHLV